MNIRSWFKQSTRTAIALACAAILVCGCALLTGCSQSSLASDATQNKLKEYANLLVTKGLDVQKGDIVAVSSSVETADFAHMCIEAAYAAGAENVLVYWSDAQAERLRLLYAGDEALATAPATFAAFCQECLESNASFLRIESPDPNASDGVDTERSLLNSQAKSAVSSEYGDKRHKDEIPWVLAGYPNTAWAEKVFPNKKGDEAVSALLDAILAAVYVTGDGTSIQTWNTHLADLKSRAGQMNTYSFVSLHYQNSSGTDLTVEMPEGHLWKSGGSITPSGKVYVANMPTEEIYSAPLKTGVNGTLAASKPLVYNNQVIEDIKLTFVDGKVVEATASQGQDALNALLDTDEGTRYLGEISLVPYDSPISNSGILFYHTLFDENASCHFALGFAYPSCLSGGTSMTENQLIARGLNRSIEHEDFMVGTSDLSITGITHDGTEVVVFKDGNFAF